MSTEVRKIVAAGSGNAMAHPTICKEIIRLTGKAKPSVLYIGTASFDSPDRFDAQSKGKTLCLLSYLLSSCSLLKANMVIYFQVLLPPAAK